MLSLLRVDSGYYVSGAIIKDGICVHSAPIIRWMVGRTFFDIEKWLHKKGFKYDITGVGDE